jgi:hypothetical protein
MWSVSGPRISFGCSWKNSVLCNSVQYRLKQFSVKVYDSLTSSLGTLTELYNWGTCLANSEMVSCINILSMRWFEGITNRIIGCSLRRLLIPVWWIIVVSTSECFTNYRLVCLLSVPIIPLFSRMTCVPTKGCCTVRTINRIAAGRGIALVATGRGIIRAITTGWGITWAITGRVIVLANTAGRGITRDTAGWGMAWVTTGRRIARVITGKVIVLANIGRRITLITNAVWCWYSVHHNGLKASS